MDNIKVNDEPVIMEEAGALGIIWLNRPHALNALNLEMIARMRMQLARWQKSPVIKGVAIASKNKRAFCAGGDIRAIYKFALHDRRKAAQFFLQEYALNHTIKHFPKPTIALIDGVWMGGGVGISIHTDCKVISDNTIFAMPETKIGYFPDVGTSYLLAKLPAFIGRMLALTASTLNCADVLGLRLANNYVASQHVDDVLSWLKDGVNWRQKLHIQIKNLWDEPPIERSRFDASLKRKIRTLFHHDHILAIEAALQQSPWPEAATWLHAMQGNSPLALALALEAQKQAKTMDFDAGLNMEAHLSKKICQSSQEFMAKEFMEGVRALMIDKDQQPQWQYQQLSDVPMKKFEAWFHHIPDQKLANLPVIT